MVACKDAVEKKNDKTLAEDDKVDSCKEGNGISPMTLGSAAAAVVEG